MNFHRLRLLTFNKSSFKVTTSRQSPNKGNSIIKIKSSVTENDDTKEKPVTNTHKSVSKCITMVNKVEHEKDSPYNRKSKSDSYQFSMSDILKKLNYRKTISLNNVKKRVFHKHSVCSKLFWKPQKKVSRNNSKESHITKNITETRKEEDNNVAAEGLQNKHLFNQNIRCNMYFCQKDERSHSLPKVRCLRRGKGLHSTTGIVTSLSKTNLRSDKSKCARNVHYNLVKFPSSSESKLPNHTMRLHQSISNLKVTNTTDNCAADKPKSIINNVCMPVDVECNITTKSLTQNNNIPVRKSNNDIDEGKPAIKTPPSIICIVIKFFDKVKHFTHFFVGTKHQSKSKMFVKCILFGVIILAWSPCIFAIWLSWCLSYPFRLQYLTCPQKSGSNRNYTDGNSINGTSKSCRNVRYEDFRREALLKHIKVHQGRCVQPRLLATNSSYELKKDPFLRKRDNVGHINRAGPTRKRNRKCYNISHIFHDILCVCNPYKRKRKGIERHTHSSTKIKVKQSSSIVISQRVIAQSNHNSGTLKQSEKLTCTCNNADFQKMSQYHKPKGQLKKIFSKMFHKGQKNKAPEQMDHPTSTKDSKKHVRNLNDCKKCFQNISDELQVMESETHRHLSAKSQNHFSSADAHADVRPQCVKCLPTTNKTVHSITNSPKASIHCKRLPKEFKRLPDSEGKKTTTGNSNRSFYLKPECKNCISISNKQPLCKKCFPAFYQNLAAKTNSRQVTRDVKFVPNKSRSDIELPKTDQEMAKHGSLRSHSAPKGTPTAYSFQKLSINSLQRPHQNKFQSGDHKSTKQQSRIRPEDKSKEFHNITRRNFIENECRKDHREGTEYDCNQYTKGHLRTKDESRYNTKNHTQKLQREYRSDHFTKDQLQNRRCKCFYDIKNQKIPLQKCTCDQYNEGRFKRTLSECIDTGISTFRRKGKKTKRGHVISRTYDMPAGAIALVCPPCKGPVKLKNYRDLKSRLRLKRKEPRRPSHICHHTKADFPKYHSVCKKSCKGRSQKIQSKKGKHKKKCIKYKICDATVPCRKKKNKSRFRSFKEFFCKWLKKQSRSISDTVEKATLDVWNSDMRCDNFYGQSLRKKHCFWLYRCWPTCYPYFLECRNCCYRTCTQCFLCLSMCFWCPLICLCYICASVCCRICNI